MSRTRLGRGLIAAFLVCASLQARPPQPASSAQIRGTIRNGSDDTPVARARVVAVADVLPQPRVVLSGPDGKYALTDLPAGSYTVSVSRTGFAAQTWGQAHAAAGTPIVLGTAQPPAIVDFALVRAASIAGRILDEDGAPFAGAAVDALVTRFDAGADTLFSVATAQTDDHGEFRLFGLAPGRYFVSAGDPAFQNVSTPGGVVHYSATYYPGVALADQARPIVLSGPTDAPRVEFKLRIVPSSVVSGQLVAADGKQLLSAAITMSPVEGEGVPIVPPDEPSIQSDGRFSFGGVLPGHYQIRARGQTASSDTALFDVFPVEVAGEDIKGIRLTLRPGAVLEGSLAVEAPRGNRPPELQTLRVRAPFIDGNSFGDSLTGTVQPNGSFALLGIMKGTHQIVVDGLHPPWVLKSVVYQGANITDTPIDATENERVRGLRVTISDAGSEVSGLVTNARRQPSAGTAVLVFSRVPLFWMRTNRRMRMAYTDDAGRFRLAGLPAGEYIAVASPEADQGDLGRQDRLKAWAAVGTPFRLDTDEAHTDVALQVVAGPSAVIAVR